MNHALGTRSRSQLLIHLRVLQFGPRQLTELQLAGIENIYRSCGRLRALQRNVPRTSNRYAVRQALCERIS
jgi:hypothetical protein